MFNFSLQQSVILMGELARYKLIFVVSCMFLYHHIVSSSHIMCLMLFLFVTDTYSSVSYRPAPSATHHPAAGKRADQGAFPLGPASVRSGAAHSWQRFGGARTPRWRPA